MYKEIDSNKRRTVLMFFIFGVVIIGLGWVFSYVYDSNAILYFAVFFAVFQSLLSYFYSDSIALAVTGARVADERQYQTLHNLVENLAITAGLPKPRVYIIDDSAPNAFATGRDPKHSAIAVTTGLLEIMDKQELEGVIAHEMSHIGNRDILVATVAVTLVGFVVLISDIFLRSLWWRGEGRSRDNNQGTAYLLIIGVVLAILAPLFAKLIQLALSRRREYLADATGALLTRYPEGLAQALEKIERYERPMQRINRATAHLFLNEPYGVEDEKRSFIMTIFSTHPPITDRVKKLRSMIGE